ncbi:c-type cytochrome [Mucilaginibacter sp. X5P1]|uniref:c-type cytochrome n=1 Tax=Mucilaginibacter sp. X5P1 TaxID=2723088 RepID=UPI00160B99E3|nr:cytochrome c [Mucilaginibacter sp. X5P1]MBB6138193.1 mono/diheme cytochrome c family protein [Mucilaginibacter sp. X5P1]
MSTKRTAIFLSLIIMLFSLGSYAQTKHKSSTHISLATSIANGKNIYIQNCASCHQTDGGGAGNMNPPLIKTTYVLGNKTTLIKIILNGFSDNVEINGQTYQNTMASHDFLKDQEIADVLTYVRNSFTNKASAVTASQVKTVRANNKPAK